MQTFLTTAAVFLGIPLLMSLIMGGMIVLGVRLGSERRRREADEIAKFAGGDIADANTQRRTGCLEAGEARCVGVCPFGALSYDEKGSIVFTPESCPFGYEKGRPHLEMGPEGRITVPPVNNAEAETSRRGRK